MSEGRSRWRPEKERTVQVALSLVVLDRATRSGGIHPFSHAVDDGSDSYPNGEEGSHSDGEGLGQVSARSEVSLLLLSINLGL